MFAFFVRRLGQAILALFCTSVLIFLAVYAIGDPAEVLIDPQATDAQVAQLRAVLGLDKPLWQQYLLFLDRAFHGSLGLSYFYKVDALDLILQRMPATFELAIVASLLALLIGIPLGFVAGVRHDTVAGRAIMGFSIAGFSLPAFWVGLCLIKFFAADLQWLPSIGRGETRELFGIQWSILTLDGWAHIILPAITLSLAKLALIIRLTRAGVREAMLMDYIKFARAKGLHPRRILGVYVMKNILIPIITVFGLELARLLTGAMIVESVFAWPGMGKLLIDSMGVLDRPILVSFLLITVATFIVINFIVDLLYSVIDPRIRLGGGSRNG